MESQYVTRKNREMGKGRELFVTRLNPVGTAAVYSASLAGDSDEQSFAIAEAGQAGLGDGIYIFNESYHCKRLPTKVL